MEQRITTSTGSVASFARVFAGSIRMRMLFVVLAALLPVVGLLVYDSVQNRHQEADRAQEDALRLAQWAAHRYRESLDSVNRFVADVANNVELRRGTPEVATQWLLRRIREHSQCVALVFFNTKGRLLAEANGPNYKSETGVSSNLWAILADRPPTEEGGQVLWISGTPMMVYGYPVLSDDAKLRGTLYAFVSLDLPEQVDVTASFSSDLAVSVVDRRGIVVARYPGSLKVLGKMVANAGEVRSFLDKRGGASVRTRALDGSDRLCGFAPVSSYQRGKPSQLMVCGSIPARVAFGKANTTLSRNLLIVGVVALLAVALGQVAAGYYVVRRVGTVMQTVDKIASGDMSARCHLTTGPDEVRRLANAFDQMAETLQRRQQERDQAEESLRDSEERFRSLTASSPVGILLTDSQGQCVYANPRCRVIFGTTLMTVLGEGWTEVIHPEDRETVTKEWRECVQHLGEFGRDFRLQVEQGEERWVHMRSAVMHAQRSDLRGHVLVVEDITSRQKAEELLRQQSTALEAAANGILLTDRDGTILWVNPAVTNLTGFSIQELIGAKTSLFKSGVQDREFYQQMWTTVLAGHIWQGELVNRRKDGTLYTEDITITPVRDVRGAVMQFVAIKQDVTQRKRAEALLRESEERYRTLIETAQDVIFTLGMDGTILTLNPAFEQVTGWPCSAWLGEKFGGLVEAADAGLAQKMFVAVMGGEKPSPFEMRVHTKDGRPCVGEFITTPQIQNGKVVGTLGIARDVTERKHLQQELYHRQKMEAVGRLAGGVAHDFNNILTAINGYSEMAMWQLSEGDPLRHNLEEIHKSSGRAAALTQQLLAFSRKQILQPRILDMNVAVTGVEKMLRRLITENIELVTSLRAKQGWIKADPGQIEQVVMNLVVNARDAMPDGGHIVIETEDITVGSALAHRHADLKPGEYVMLTVSDTGHGISDDVKAHIFEPFFTTKPQGQGTGLGLATCFGIVQQSEGHIEVESKVGEGAVFRVYLPKVSASEVTPEEAPPAMHLPKGGETILVAEDEPAVREFVVAMLRELGYNVLEAANGVEGCQLAQEKTDGKIDLLLTDIVIPEMGGRELADWFGQNHPQTKVLFTTGYTTDPRVGQAVRDGRVALLEKPFSPTTLASKVREVLEQRPSSQ